MLTLEQFYSIKNELPDDWGFSYTEALGNALDNRAQRVKSRLIEKKKNDDNYDHSIHENNFIEFLKVMVSESGYKDTKLLGSGIQISPEDFKSELGVYIDSEPESYITGLLFSNWLWANGTLDDIREGLHKWLKPKKNKENKIISRHLYSSWLNSKGDRSLVEKPMLAWLEKHETISDANFVYSAWLKAGGDTSLIRYSIELWLDRNSTNPIARFVYSAWLRAEGDFRLVEKPLEAWLNIHGESLDASHVLSAWLAPCGKKVKLPDSTIEIIQEHVVGWLENHWETEDAQRIYSAWLITVGKKYLDASLVEGWMCKYKSSVDAHYVYTAWLKAKGENFPVERNISAWVDKEGNSTIPKAWHLYQAWLQSYGDKSLIRTAICD